MTHSLEISHPSHYPESHSDAAHTKELNPHHDIEKTEEIRLELYDALEHKHPIEAIDALDRLPIEDIRWRLAGANDIYERFLDTVPNDVLTEIQQSIKHDAIELGKRRLLPDELSGLNLDPHHFDDAGSERPPEVKDVSLIGQAWDNTDEDPLIGELFVRMVHHLEPHIAESFESAFQSALEDETLTFKHALLRINARLNELTMDQAKISRYSDSEPLATNEELEKYGVRKPSLDEVAEKFGFFTRET